MTKYLNLIHITFKRAIVKAFDGHAIYRTTSPKQNSETKRFEANERLATRDRVDWRLPKLIRQKLTAIAHLITRLYVLFLQYLSGAC